MRGRACRRGIRQLRLSAFRSHFFFPVRLCLFFIAGHGRSENGVASLAYAGNPCSGEA